MTMGETLVVVGVAGVGVYLLWKKLTASAIPVVAPPARGAAANLGFPPGTSVGAAVGTIYASGLPAPLAKVAAPVASTVGNNIETGLKTQLKGDWQLVSGHPVTGIENVGKGLYDVTGKTFVSGAKSVVHFLGRL